MLQILSKYYICMYKTLILLNHFSETAGPIFTKFRVQVSKFFSNCHALLTNRIAMSIYVKMYKNAFVVMSSGGQWVMKVMSIAATSLIHIQLWFLYVFRLSLLYLQVSQCTFVVITTGVYWVLSVMTIAVTSLIPIFHSFKPILDLFTFKYQSINTFAVITTGVYWVLTVILIAVTSLIPIFHSFKPTLDLFTFRYHSVPLLWSRLVYTGSWQSY